MEPTLQQAVQDLALIRKAIEQADHRAENPRPGVAAKAHLLILGIGFVLAAFLILLELWSAGVMSWSLALSRHDHEMGVEGLYEVGLCLPFLLAAL